MKALLILGLGFLISTNASANSSAEICEWENKAGYTYSTDGHTWGGSDFSSLQECSNIVRAALISIDYGQGDGTGILTFAKAAQEQTLCKVKALKFPYSQAPNGFYDVIQRAFEGTTSAKELEPYQAFLDRNLRVRCN